MKLFEPGKIGNITLKNRIVMAPMGTKLMEMDGRISERAIDYYTARAKGGVGMIIVAPARTRYIEQSSITPLVDQLTIDEKHYASRYNELVESAHDYGTALCVQVTPGMGRNIGSSVLHGGTGAVAPSPLPSFYDPSIMTRELKTKEIEKLAQAFKLMGEVVRIAGADAIEINAHAGYLTDEFMTSLWNKRNDKYGGNLDGRLAFLMEIIDNIRKGAGNDFPILVKFGLTHHLEGGRIIEEGLQIARKLEQAGIAALDIDSGCYETMYYVHPTTYQHPGLNVELAWQVKQTVNIPVITVGRLEYPDLAEKVLADGKADFIALGKGLLADPEWANKVKTGKTKYVVPCLGCNEGCFKRISSGMYISCAVNPACGNERELALKPCDKKKMVMVIGGGPGGMEAAAISSIRGHKVTLYEKTGTLGGNLIPASVPNFKRDYRRYIDFLSRHISNSGVDVKLNTEVTPAFVKKCKPDVIFVATGAVSYTPAIPGADKAASAIDVLLGVQKTGKSVAVIGGGDMGCELAIHLAMQGKKVTVVEMLDRYATDLIVNVRMGLTKMLNDTGVTLMVSTCAREVNDKGLIVTDNKGKTIVMEVDTVVLACGLKPNNLLVSKLQNSAPEVFSIGDCVKPRKVIDAVKEGFRRARMV